MAALPTFSSVRKPCDKKEVLLAKMCEEQVLFNDQHTLLSFTHHHVINKGNLIIQGSNLALFLIDLVIGSCCYCCYQDNNERIQ